MSVSAGGQGVQEGRRATAAFQEPTPDGSRPSAQASIGELLKAITRDTSTLVRQEIQLAKVELRQEVRTATRVVAMFGGAALGGLMVLLFLSYAGWWGLANVMDQGLAALVIAGAWALIAVLLVAVARGQARSLKALPQTSGSVRRVPAALRGRTQRESEGRR